MLSDYAMTILNPIYSIIALILFVIAFLLILSQFLFTKKSEYTKRANLVFTEKPFTELKQKQSGNENESRRS